ELRRAAVQRPGDERLAGQAMLALAATGRQAEALARFDATRRHLVERLGAEPGAELIRIQLRVLKGLNDTTTPPPRPGAQVPRQLPPAPRRFTGRLRERSMMDDALASGAPVVALSGPGGIGKTWLATRWASDNLARFPHGQLHIDLHGFDPSRQPVTAEKALRALLGGLGVPSTAIPSDVEQASGLLRSKTSGRALVVVLDNARDHRQVAPLLPGEGCFTIVTGRVELAGLVASHGAASIAVSSLSDVEAHDALAMHLGDGRVAAEPEAAAALVTHCAGLPLALGIVAANAATRPDRSLSSLTADLRDRATLLDELETGDLSASLRSVLATSLRAVSDAARSMFSCLGLAFTTTVSVDAAASLAARSPAAARKSLRELETAHLLDRDAAGRHRLHDLTALYAAEVADDTIDDPRRRRARRRLVDHYLHASYSAARVFPSMTSISLEEPLERTIVSVVDSDDALDWYAVEYPNLLAAQESAEDLSMDGHVWRLAWITGRYQWAQGRWSDGIAGWSRARHATDRLGDPRAQAIIYIGLSTLCVASGDLDRAESITTEAVRFAARTGDVPLRLSSHMSLCVIADARGDHAAGREHAQRMVELSASTDSRRWGAIAYNSLGWSEAKLGDLDAAQAHLETSLSIFATTEATHSLADVWFQRGDYPTALHWYTRRLEMTRRQNNEHTLPTDCERIGDCHARMDDPRQARQWWSDAVELLREQGRQREWESIQDKIAALGPPDRDD
ncbi:MAG TPA: BTAD domain-containing putative transcriptional regulator, partial [Stackebrandtia sp.]|uniref:BTAD domain-containing putative transcriptional regulator n=1 Tax=Stackebrandtia sp. TaxID=2023065 RepID=UPI002D4460E5